MIGICPACRREYPLPSTRAAGIRGRLCPADHSQLVGLTALRCGQRCQVTLEYMPADPRFRMPIKIEVACGRQRGHDLPHGSADGRQVYAALPPRCAFVGRPAHWRAGRGGARCALDRGHTAEHEAHDQLLVPVARG